MNGLEKFRAQHLLTGSVLDATIRNESIAFQPHPRKGIEQLPAVGIRFWPRGKMQGYFYYVEYLDTGVKIHTLIGEDDITPDGERYLTLLPSPNTPSPRILNATASIANSFFLHHGLVDYADVAGSVSPSGSPEALRESKDTIDFLRSHMVKSEPSF